MLPILDIAPLFDGSPSARRAVARQIGEACQATGFLYVRGHRVADSVIVALQAAMTAYFALPLEEKRRLTRPAGRYRGYVPPIAFGQNRPGAPAALYEAFVFGEEAAPDDPEAAASGGLYGANLWPAAPPGFRAAATAYWRAVDAVAKRLLAGFALALERDERTLLRFFRKPLSNVSLLHYFARPGTTMAPADDLAAHRDTNAITVLLPSPVGGLEVRRDDGRFVAVPPEPGCFVVNVGNMMECWSGGRFRSTWHRVHPPRDRERYSIGFFAVPDYATLVQPLSGLPVVGTAEDTMPRHAGRDLAAFVANFDRLVREAAAG